MWRGIKVGAVALRDALTEFFSGPFFFILLGCTFIGASYILLTQTGPCGKDLAAMSCLKLSQLNLAFGLLAALLGAGLLIYGTALQATRQGQIAGIKQVYDELKLFFASPMFFILLGALFIYCALILLDETHTGFVFILAVLGIAMILFGTGSQAVLSGELPPAAVGKISVGIAGGAAALAAIFGYGIVYLESGIQEFFKRTVDYGFVELTTAGTANQTVDLDEHIVSATTIEGRPLHLWKQTNRMQIMVPRYSQHHTSTIAVSIRGPRIPANSPPTTYTVNWESVSPSATAANERIYIAHQNLTASLAPTATLLVDEAGKPLPSVTIPPPR
jgi:hypothetical protein